MVTPRILIVLTSHDQMGDTDEKTGFWLEEFTSPYYTFLDAGAEVTLASIQGGPAPIDARSLGEDSQTETTQRFMADEAAKQALANTMPVSDASVDDYDAIFLPGGHGTMWDFPESTALTTLIEAFDRAGKVISAVCHAPAALVNVKADNGASLVKGKKITAFTDSEERAVQLEAVVPFMLETRLRELGADFEGGPDFTPLIQQDGNLITGQNPPSSEPAAKAVLAALQ
ncbi:MAG: type 1 glutamine amidotransferase domain-containing protein [Leptolyngbya sp. SIO1D8]|nr:type 1 glutamine amidotransferase domain-containing protein [Leptolyngbya sp. SIO1D8]